MNKLVIIGGGPSGYETALQAKEAGFDVVVIEKNELGGVCLWEGCIPTKTLLQSAKQYKASLEAGKFGVIHNEPTLDYQAVLLRKSGVIFRLHEGIKYRMDQANIRVIKGEAHIVAPHRVFVNDEIIECDIIILATGSHCRSLPNISLFHPRILHAKDALNLTALPKSMLIVGSGVIGSEFASLYAELGVSVTMLEMQDSILPIVDSEVAKRLSVAFKRKGINVKTGVTIRKVEASDESIKVYFCEKNKEQSLQADYLLVAIGREPNLDKCELDRLGIAYTTRGIIVDEHYQTSIPSIYAIGDINGQSLLAHSAVFQGKVLLHHLNQSKNIIRLDLTPSVIFTLPEIAYVGKKENEFLPGEYKVYKSLYTANCMANIYDETYGFVKIITDINDVIKGAHIIGHDASLLIGEMVVAMNNTMTLAQFKAVIHAHPTLNEILQDVKE